MNAKCFIFLEIVARLCNVVSYTVILKQVQPLYQPVKVYRYDHLRPPKVISEGNLLHPYRAISGQKIYPVKGKNFRPRGGGKKDSKYVKSLSTEKPHQRDFGLYGIPRQLVPPLSNQLEEYSETKVGTEEETLPKDLDARPLAAAPSPEKSFASFEQEKGKIYKNAGEWATPPSEDSENTTQSAFIPSQLYLQIRHKNTVIHVPQSEALKDAETLEELINAPRLKELARTTHVQETYSEEGYEDAAYDHAGQIRQAQHGEIYDAKDKGKFKIKEAPVILHYDSDLEESKRSSIKNTASGANQREEISNKLEPRIMRPRVELGKTGMEYNKEPPASYKGGHLFSSRVKTLEPKESNGSVGPATFPSFFGEMPLPPDDVFANNSDLTYTTPSKISSKYRQEDLNATKIYPVGQPAKRPSDVIAYISPVDSQPSPSARSLKYSRIYSKKTKQLRLEPYKTGNVYTPSPPTPPSPPSKRLTPPVEETPEGPFSQRIVLPTIGYINSLTTAHFGKEFSSTVKKEPESELTSALNLTQALSYLRSNKDRKGIEESNIFNETNVKTFEPMRLKKHRPRDRNFASKTKRDVYLMSPSEQSEYEVIDEEDAAHNEKNSEISDEERKRVEEEDREKAKFEAELRDEITAKEKEIIKEAFRSIGDDFPEGFLEHSSSSESDSRYLQSTTPSLIDFKKYPFYGSKRLPENSPLRYASDPLTFPRKSGHGMEFYESREQLIQCPDFRPHLPNSNSTEHSQGQAGENQRLTGLGDKITCLRSKYFDPEPFDNPIFKEREIDYVGKPKKSFGKFISSQSQTAAKILKPLREYKKFAAPASNTKKTEILLTTKDGAHDTPQGSKPFSPRHRAGKHFIPIKVLPLVPLTKAASPLIKPVTEITKGVSSFAAEPAVNVKPGVRWKTFFHPESASPEPSRIVLKENCVDVIAKIAALDGANNLTIQCDDATLVQEIINGVAYVRIIPNERWSAKMSPQQRQNESDWVPITGYARTNFAKWLNRKTDELTSPKNETTPKPSSDQYVIDELKEDKSVRQGEVVEDIDHYLKMTGRGEMTTEVVNGTEKRKKREAIDLERKKGQRPTGSVVFDAIEKITQAQVPVINKTDTTTKVTLSKLFEAKRTLGRLSGRDFLTRYHKNKSKPKPVDFWKIANTSKIVQKHHTTPVNILHKVPQENSTSNVAFKASGSNEKPTDAKNHATKFKSSDAQTLPPMSVSKKPENRFPESGTDKIFENVTKIIRKVSKEVSERNEKPTIVNEEHPTIISKDNVLRSSKKPEGQYKAINRNKNFSKKTELENASPDGPILYYIMDVRTGMGKWVTNYEEQRRSRKFGKARKLKENFGAKRDKKRKQTKY